MGSYNGTCMVSNLPIVSGDKVKLVLLHNPYVTIDINENPFLSSGVAYSGTYLQPAFFPISGKYDDYGRIHNIIEDNNYEIITKVLKTELGDVITIDGDNITDWKLEDVLHGIQTDVVEYYGTSRKERENQEFAKLYVKSFPDDESIILENLEKEFKIYKDLAEKELIPEKQILNFSFIMIKEDIWDHIIENYDGQYFNPLRDSSNADIPFYITALEYYKFKFNKQLDEINSVIEDINTLPEDEKPDSSYLVKRVSRNNIFNETYAGSNELYSHNDYFDYLFDGKKLLSSNECDSLFKHWSELMIISSYISGTRRLWLIQSGEGSQHEGWKDYMILSDKIKEICEAKIKERKEWDEEYE